MNFSRNTVITIVITSAVVLLNTLVFYTVYCTGDIIQSVGIYGEEHTFIRSDINRQSRIITTLPESKMDAIAYIEEHIARLNDYRIAAEYISGDQTSAGKWGNLSTTACTEKAEQLYAEYTSSMTSPDPQTITDTITADIALYESIRSKITYAIDYDKYIDDVIKNSESLSQIGIYRDDSFLLSNINKTRKDFYGLDSIDISIVPDAGVTTLVNCRFTDIFALFLVLLTIVIAFLQDKERADTLLYHHKPILPIIVLATGIVTMYLFNGLLTSMFICDIPFDALVQSFTPFRNCPYSISFGVFCVLSIIIKLLGCMTVFALASTVITADGKKRIFFSATIGCFVLIELLTAFSDSGNKFITVLREINLVSSFTFERFFVRYLNLNIASVAVSRLLLFFPFIVLLFILSFSMAMRGFTKNAQRLVSEAERGYYDEINRRYMESRKIRHDISNHLLAISALIESGKTDEARHYINEVSVKNDLAAMPAKTGASVLDALLYKKAEYAKENGIDFTIEVNCPLGNTSISNYDLCSIFGNILDNALKAVQPLESNRRITISIEKQLDILYIRCDNPYSGELHTRGDKFLTSKPDTALHGYGISRVRDIAHKHGGDVKITTENGIFLIEILMNM